VANDEARVREMTTTEIGVSEQAIRTMTVDVLRRFFEA